MAHEQNNGAHDRDSFMIEGRAPRNRTLTLSSQEETRFASRLVILSGSATLAQVRDRTLCQDAFKALDLLPEGSVDLLFADPPYNLTKTFAGNTFEQQSESEYEAWLEEWISKLPRLLKKTSSIYICGDWRSSDCIRQVAERHFIVRNRITWEREKGRGATKNWKNSSEDVWFCTMSDSYTFNLESVKIKRRVIAPYIDPNGTPKDWVYMDEGKYRLTHPSNLWTDLTVPFWSMPENTEHPTQKPEKMLARVILASSNAGDLVLDPFLGSGTTSVVCKKLQRHFIGIEIEKRYCLLAEKRLMIASQSSTIQGFEGGVFWERNSLSDQKNAKSAIEEAAQPSLFDFAE